MLLVITTITSIMLHNVYDFYTCNSLLGSASRVYYTQGKTDVLYTSHAYG